MRKILICIFLAWLSCGSYAQFKLEVEIVNLPNDKGQLMLELFDAKEQSIKGLKAKIKDQKCTVVIDSLANAQYAIRFFHDENSNEELDTNWMGIPKEAYGFSNDAYGRFGPKDFKEWLFEVNEDIKISLRASDKM